jgi:hypothetical protein
MVFDYIKNVGERAISNAVEEDAMIAITLTACAGFWIFFVWFLKISNAPKKVKESPNPVSKKRILFKFLRQEWLRIVLIPVILLAFHLLIRAPYVLYINDQTAIHTLSPPEYAEIEAAIKSSGETKTEWVRMKLINAARRA